MKSGALFGKLKRITSIIKDAQLSMFFSALLASLTSETVFSVLAPSLPILLPVLALSLGALAAMHTYRLITTPKAKPQHWIKMLFGITTAVLANIAIWSLFTTSAALATALYPLLLATISSACLMHIVLAGVNFYQAFTAPSNSNERMHLIQSGVKNSLLTLQLAFFLATALTVAIFPVSPVVIMVFASLSVAMIASHLIWQILPKQTKSNIKGFFGFSNPEAAMEPEPETIKELDHDQRPVQTAIKFDNPTPKQHFLKRNLSEPAIAFGNNFFEQDAKVDMRSQEDLTISMDAVATP